MRGAWNAPPESYNTCLGHRLGSRFCLGSWLFTLLRSELCRDCFLYFFDIHPETLRGIDKQVLRCVSPLIGRVEQADFEQKPRKPSFIIGTDLLHQHFLWWLGVFGSIDLLPLRQNWDLVVGQMADGVLRDREQVGFL